MMSSVAVASQSVLVVCLCAEWCGVCRDYRSRFDEVKARFPGVEFLWIDVEDEADLLHPLDIDNFPTLLVGVGDEPRFLGPLTPQIETLDRLIRAQMQVEVMVKAPDALQVGLLARIRQAKGLSPSATGPLT
ncbi:thioredoxin family protein [Rhodoferax sp. PAMC 29310]|uniref:thioredoxin family protein n=1 Tax=Rhodoferax sp. PAMC 29310 TaxID=2822760 RepID=UPI001F0B0ECD|nr:thioredoxin family protein [Rhodoferax sp. PAMC 29310]